MEKKETFRVFKDAPAAKDLAVWLGNRGIDAEVGDNLGYFDPSFSGSILHREWRVELAASDFGRANDLLRKFYTERLAGVPGDYYLFSFSTDELEAIVTKPDEWGDLDYALATCLLRERGRNISDAELQTIRNERYQALSAPDTVDAGNYISWGYGFALLGGFIGALIGWHLSNSRKVLPDGKRVSRYDSETRAHGRRIFRIGLLVSAVLVIVRMYILYQYNIGDFFPGNQAS